MVWYGIKMQDTKAMTALFPCYENVLVARNGQGYETSYQGPADAASNMRAAP